MREKVLGWPAISLTKGLADARQRFVPRDPQDASATALDVFELPFGHGLVSPSRLDVLFPNIENALKHGATASSSSGWTCLPILMLLLVF